MWFVLYVMYSVQGWSGCVQCKSWGSKARFGCDSTLARRALPWVPYRAELHWLSAWVSRQTFLHPAVYGHAQDRLASQFEIVCREYRAASYCMLSSSCVFLKEALQRGQGIEHAALIAKYGLPGSYLTVFKINRILDKTEKRRSKKVSLAF